MALYPDVQSRARQEILDAYKRLSLAEDEFLSPNDLHQLEYLNAVMKEVFRFAPVANLGTLVATSLNESLRQFPF